jgi:hypothetical protein
MPAVRGDTPDPQTYVTASKAASMLGLEERLIEWALDRHYLWTRDDRTNDATKRGAGLPDEPKTDQAIGAPVVPPATPDPAEVARLGKRIDQLLATVAAKDELIAELARSVSRMGEMALERLPRSKN